MKECHSFSQLRHMEVVNVCDGKRLGCVCDVEIDDSTGYIQSLIVPGPSRFFGLLGREDDYVIAWQEIERMGEDIILVRFPPESEKNKKMT